MATDSKLPPHSLNWDLDSLFPAPSDAGFSPVVDEYRGRLQALAARSDSLAAPSAATARIWVEFLQEFEWIEARGGDLSSFISCHAAADAGNALFRQYEAALSSLDPLRERISTSVEFAFCGADEHAFARFIEAEPWLQANEFYLRLRRSNAQMRLPRAEELLAADLAVDGLHAWGRLYDRLSGELRIRVMEKGDIVEKSPGQIRFDSIDRSIRQNNFYAAEKAWKGIADSCADAINHIAGTRLTIYRRLKLADHLEMPLHRNRLQRETLSAMWSAVSQRKSMLLKFLDAKARLLGLEKLCWYDTQAPLPSFDRSACQSEVSYDDGADLVVETFGSFSPEMGDFARHALDRRWIEAENRSGKRQGAFCTGFPSQRESRVFMTFTNTYDNVSTLAHELGHAYHAWVLKDQPLFLQDYPMNLAETASTFAEAVLAEERLKRADSRGEKLSILDHMLSDAVAYLMNIYARFLFEDRMHVERASGELTAARLSELMLASQREAYLDGLASDGWYADMWISKLHFYISGLPFYNFPYTFGYLLSTGLFALASELGAEFPGRYRRLLVATGCMDTEAAVKSTFGYDLTGSEFWNKSLEVVERRVEQFLELAALG